MSFRHIGLDEHGASDAMIGLQEGPHIMVIEIAQIDIKPGQEAEFEAGVAKAAPLFKRAKGCRSLSLQRSVEKPGRYRLFVGWDTVENHTKDFYGGADWQEWRKLVAHTFEGPPSVEHIQETLKAF